MIYFISTFLFILSAFVLILKLIFDKIMDDCLFSDILESNHFARFKAGIFIIIKDVISDIKNGRLKPISDWERIEENTDNHTVSIVETQEADAYVPADLVCSPPKEENGETVNENVQRRNPRRRRVNQPPFMRLPIRIPPGPNQHAI